MKLLKVGFLVDGLDVSSQVMELVKYVEDSELFCEPVIIHGYFGEEKVGRLKKLFKIYKKVGFLGVINYFALTLMRRLIMKVELNATKIQYPDYGKSFNLRSLSSFKEVILAGCWSKSGFYLSFQKMIYQ